MRSYPRNPKKFEKGLPICPICKMAMPKIENGDEVEFVCPPICGIQAIKSEKDGS